MSIFNEYLFKIIDSIYLKLSNVYSIMLISKNKVIWNK